MKTYDIFKLSLGHVRKSKMRSWLTIVGIVIGVVSGTSEIILGNEKASVAISGIDNHSMALHNYYWPCYASEECSKDESCGCAEV